MIIQTNQKVNNEIKTSIIKNLLETSIEKLKSNKLKMSSSSYLIKTQGIYFFSKKWSKINKQYVFDSLLGKVHIGYMGKSNNMEMFIKQETLNFTKKFMSYNNTTFSSYDFDEMVQVIIDKL